MGTINIRFSVFASGLFGAMILMGVACSSDKNTNATPTNGGSGATGGNSSVGGSTGTTGGSTSSGTSGGSTSAAGGSTSAATGGAGGACVPDSTKTCYSCSSTNSDYFYNACSSAACYKFDNAGKNIPNPLPAIP